MCLLGARALVQVACCFKSGRSAGSPVRPRDRKQSPGHIVHGPAASRHRPGTPASGLERLVKHGSDVAARSSTLPTITSANILSRHQLGGLNYIKTLFLPSSAPCLSAFSCLIRRRRVMTCSILVYAALVRESLLRVLPGGFPFRPVFSFQIWARVVGVARRVAALIADAMSAWRSANITKIGRPHDITVDGPKCVFVSRTDSKDRNGSVATRITYLQRPVQDHGSHQEVVIPGRLVRRSGRYPRSPGRVI